MTRFHTRTASGAGIFLALSLLCVRPATAQSYTAIDLGARVSPTALNDSLQVAGQVNPMPNGPIHAIIWNRGTGIIDLQTLAGPGYTNGASSTATGINNSGQVVGFSNISASNGIEHAFRWDPVLGMKDLGTLGGNNSWANGINAGGQVVGGSQTASGETHAFVWDSVHGMKDLGTLGGAFGVAFSINTSGQIVGKSSTATSTFNHAALWQNGTVTDISALGDGDNLGNTITDDGVVVGQYGNGEVLDGFIWDKTNGLRELPGFSPVGRNINGRMVGTALPGVLQSNSTAAVWYRDGTFSLQDRVTSTNISAVTPPAAINQAAWTITSGILARDSSEHGFLLKPNMDDFNGDGISDLIVQTSTPGQVGIWYGGNSKTPGVVDTLLPTGWQVAGVGDFNGDGNPDLVIQNLTTRQVAIWYMDYATVLSGQYVSETLPTGWQVAGAGDFNGDGKYEILLENLTSDRLALWYMNGATVTSGVYLNQMLPPGSQVAAVGDLNLDGVSDIIFQQVTKGVLSGGSVLIGYVNAGQISGWTYPSEPGLSQQADLPLPTGWQIAGLLLHSATGVNIALQNPTTGQTAYWQITAPYGGAPLMVLGSYGTPLSAGQLILGP